MCKTLIFHTTPTKMKTVLFLFALVAVLTFAIAAPLHPGSKQEHKEDPTPSMRRAIDAVLAQLTKQHGHKHVLTKIDRIMHQIVAGRLYHLNIRVKSDQIAEYAVSATVHQKLDDSLEVTNVETGRRFDTLNQDERKALFKAMDHLSTKYGETMELVMIKNVKPQVVSGVMYHFEINVKGPKTPLKEETVAVHHHWNGEMNVNI